VYASLYLSHARAYRKLVGLTGPGKMAIMVQNMVGQVWNSPNGQQYYCPEISCACFSYDNHGKGAVKKEDGIARIALGMGHGVVGGNLGMAVEANLGKPYPLRGFDSVERILKVSPRHFYALDLSSPDALPDSENFFLKKHSIAEMADPKMVKFHLSGYDGDIIRPGSGGAPVYNFPYLFDERNSQFMNVMKFQNKILMEDMGMDADHEDAYLIANVGGERYEIFFPLQARPQVHSGKSRLDALPDVQNSRTVLSIQNAIGNGRYSIDAAIFVPLSAFSSKSANEISQEIASMNKALETEGKKYVLFVPGRFGNAEPEHYCGIPGSIETVSGTSGVFEHMPKDSFTPGSQGDHFAVEFSSLGIAAGDYQNEVDLLGRLNKHATSSKNGKYATVFQFSKPLEMLIDKSDNLLIHAP
jgi:hypothetical protein